MRVAESLEAALDDLRTLLALLFFGIAGGLMVWLHKSHQEKQQTQPPKFGFGLVKDLALAGAVTFINAAGVRRR